MKPLKLIPVFIILILLTYSFSGFAQTPQWAWAKGVGSNGQDGINLGMHIDSAGNQYEIMSIGGRSITLAGQTLSIPAPRPLVAVAGISTFL